ncbi:MAG: VCBS repeat-containing protein, partial [Myxococcota bacterium]|nr:VCBS repeat-containing protein [Myxococcota bacterium]
WYDGVDSDCDGEPEPDVCADPPGGDRFDADPGCTYTPGPPDAWDIRVEWSTDPAMAWSWSTSEDATNVMMTPVVGQLTDDNGDGVIDGQDIPDIAFSTFRGDLWAGQGVLRVVSGDGSGEHWSLAALVEGSTTHLPHAGSGLAIGDIDADGVPELLTMTYYGHLLALEADGSFAWVSSVGGMSPYGDPSITDMDGDGLAEVIVGEFILDHDGVLLGTAPSTGGGNFAADLDGDGRLEHVSGNAVTEMDGTVRWHDTTRSAGWPAVMDWDGDGDGDVLNQHDGVLTVYDENGAVLLDATIAASGRGAPCVGDLDADGEPEVAFTTATSVLAVDTDGTVLWTADNEDASSGGTPCTTWDFDGDGDFEVLVADEVSLRILDGADGTALLVEDRHASGTLDEQPVPVDVDRDGNTEIVLASNDYYQPGWVGIHVLGEARDEWATTRTTWNQGAFWSGNIDDDMAIPSPMDMPWDLDNGFRSQRSPTTDPRATQDFRVEILGVCEDCVEGQVEVWVSPLNAGSLWGPAGVHVSLYVDDGSGQRLVEVQRTPGILGPGERLPPMTFDVPLSVYASGEMVAVIDDYGSGMGLHNECDEANNSARWGVPVCE